MLDINGLKIKPFTDEEKELNREVELIGDIDRLPKEKYIRLIALRCKSSSYLTLEEATELATLQWAAKHSPEKTEAGLSTENLVRLLSLRKKIKN